MSVSSEDFISLARRLAEETSEIDYRSSISRAYYALYHTACDAAEHMKLEGSGRRDVGAHEQLIGRFEAQGKRLKSIGARLRSRKLVRAMADYQLSEVVLQDEARLFAIETGKLCSEIVGLKERSSKAE